MFRRVISYFIASLLLITALSAASIYAQEETPERQRLLPLSLQLIPVSSGTQDSQAILIVTPQGKNILYDSGRWSDHGEQVSTYLEQAGVQQLDALITSIADMDHMGGHIQMLDWLAPDGVIVTSGFPNDISLYRDFVDEVCDRGMVSQFRVVEAGDSLEIDSLVAIEFFNPFVAGPHRDPCNQRFRDPLTDRLENNSLVMKLTFGLQSFLIAGSVGEEAETIMAGYFGDELYSSFLVVADHGSWSSTNEFFLKKVDPVAALISSAPFSYAGNPDCGVLERLANHEVPVFWSAFNLTIVAFTDGVDPFALVERGGPSDFRFLLGCPIEEADSVENPEENRDESEEG
jgi:competence protein ComEC